MAENKKANLSGSRRVKGNRFTTKSGKTIKVNRTMTEHAKARKDAKALRKAERNKDLPKGKIKRTLYKIHPKRVAAYWFSRDGASSAIKIAGFSVVVGFFLLIALFAYFRKDLPNLRNVDGDTIGGSIRYYDKTGDVLLWEDYDAVKRVSVDADQISDNLREATIALEDRTFYEHSGFNVRGISRAAWNNAFGGDTQGGSTITQQLVKLTTPGFSDEQTVARKIKEIIIAVELERSYTKDQILTGYMNAAPYGTIEYGAEVAARTYFNKSAKDLSIAEAAFLASIPKSPPTYTPHSPSFDANALAQRQDYTIDVMFDLKMITQEEKDTAKADDTITSVVPRQPSKYTGILAPHFVLAAKNQLINILQKESVYNRGGLKVITTIDMNLQKIAEEEVTSGIAQIERQRGDTAAFVAEDVTNGQVVALIGGADFNNKDKAGEVNFAQQPLPPGSSFKPYDYLALLENTENSGAGSVLYDTQGPLEGYPCTDKTLSRTKGNCLKDYDLRYPGPVTLRYALGGSRNVPAVKAMLIAGVDKTISTANKLGLYDDEYGTGGYKCYSDEFYTVPTQCYASSGIGDGAYLNLDKHVHAYSTISRNGNKIPQAYILNVEDSSNREIYKWVQKPGEQVVRDESAYIVADMMADPRASYMARKNHDYKGWDFSIKTGTTNDSKDGWMMGFSTKYSAGIWVGHHTGKVEMTGFMETMTQGIWVDWMQRAHDGLQPVARVRPAGIQVLPAYIVRSHIGASSIEPSPTTDLFPSWYKKPGSSAEEKIIKDKVSQKRSTECTPPLAIEEVVQTDAASYSSDPFYDSATNTQDSDDVHKCDDVKPTISISMNAVSTGKYTVQISVGNGTHPISSDKFTGQLNVTIDGEAIPNGSIQIAGPGIYAIDYTSIYDTTKTVTAEIVDSVLYSSVDAMDYPFVLP